MTDYIDLVLVAHAKGGQKYLFEAPGFSGLEAGDHVTCDTVKGLSPGRVTHVVTIAKGNAYIDMLAAAANATLPLKRITHKWVCTELKYPEEEERNVPV